MDKTIVEMETRIKKLEDQVSKLEDLQLWIHVDETRQRIRELEAATIWNGTFRSLVKNLDIHDLPEDEQEMTKEELDEYFGRRGLLATTEKNLVKAKKCNSEMRACLMFRNLEHAQNRGTTQDQFDILRKHYKETDHD